MWLATGAHTKVTNKYAAVMIHYVVSVIYKSFYNLFWFEKVHDSNKFAVHFWKVEKESELPAFISCWPHNLLVNTLL